MQGQKDGAAMSDEMETTEMKTNKKNCPSEEFGRFLF